MASFLDDLSVYNAKAAVAISNAVADRQYDKANMMSGLKATANDTSLTEAIRLNALTALINLGQLLDVPLAPYFPVSITYGDTQTYQGIHNDLTGLQGGTAGQYYHLTSAQLNKVSLAATLSDITFANLLGVYSDNAGLAAVIDSKQTQLNGTGFVRATGTTISYDNTTYLSTITGIAAGGELTGTYPNPGLSNAAVIGKVLTGWNGSVSPSSITSGDSILSALQKLNANLNQVIASPSGVASVGLTNNAGTVFTTTTGPLTGAVTLNIGLNTQNANLVLASGTASNGQQPAFRSLVVADLPSSGATPGNYGGAAQIPQITVDAKGRITSISTVAAAGGGQVNSVGLSIPSSIFSAVTNTGTAADPILTYGLDTQTANYVWAGPVTGAAVVPAFRALVEDDIPNLSITKITNLDNELSTFLTRNLANSTIFIGNTSDAPVGGEVTGDLTVAYVNNNGNDEADFTIANGVVTYQKIQDVTAETLLGRYFATNGEVQELTLDPTAFTINNSTGVIGLQTPNPSLLTNKGDLLTRDASAPVRLGVGANATIFMADTAATTGNKWVAMSGDATIATSGAVTIANSAVTLAKMADLPANTVIGNNTGSTGVPLALTRAQLTAMVNQFSTSLSGVVPAATNTGYFLRGDGTWQPVSGTGTVTTISVATNNGFAGTVANPTTAPIITLTTTVNGMVKGNGTALSAATAGTDYISPGQITQTTGPGSGLTMASGNLLGRTTASAGPIEAISVNSSLTLSTLTLGINLGNSNAWTAQQQMPSIRLNGSTSGFVLIQPPAVAGAQTYTLPTTTPTAGQFLTGTGGVLSWATPAGSGATTNAVTFNNSGSGAASGTTFDGSVARTISYNTIGAQASNTNLTGLSGLTYVSGTPFVKMTGAGTFALDNNTYISGTTTQYAVLIGGAGNSIASITPTTSNKILISNGTGSNPGWTDAQYLSSTTQYGILYSSATNVVAEIPAPGTAGLYLQWTGSGYTWAAGGGGGGGGSVTSFSFVPANGFSGTVANATSTPALTLTTSISGILKGSAGALVAAIPSVDYAPATSGTFILKGNGSGGFANAVAGTDYLTSVGLTMPAAFSVANSPLTANGTLAVTAAGTAAQYIRGDGQLALLPTSGGGGGGSVNYYLNGSVASSVVGYEQMSKTPVIGAGTDFTLTNTAGYIASFLTDAGDPSLLNIPAGAWEFNLFLQSSNGTGSPNFYVEVYTYDGTTFTLLGTSSTEPLSSGTSIQYYSTSVGISSTPLSLTDRIAVRIYVNTAGNRTITLHTEDSHLCQVVTTFTSGIVSLNGLNAQTQFFSNGSSGLAPNWSSVTATHTLNIPLASTASVTAGLISNTDYTTFSNKISNPMTTLGDIIYGGTVVGGVATPTRLGIGSTNQVLSVVGGIPAWTSAGSGDVTGPSSSTDGNFAVFNSTTGKIIMESAAASLGSGSGGRATFNNGVDVGVSSSTTGTLVFRNSTNAFTTTIQASTGATANANYTWPAAPGTLGQILRTDGSGNLSWVAAGAGDMVLATAGQVVTGSKIYADTTLLLRNPANSFSTTLSAGTSTAARTITFPDLTGTVALLDNAQTFTGAKTFGTATTTFNLAATTATPISITGAGSTSNPHININGGLSTISWIQFALSTGAAAPAVGTRSAGTKIVIWPGLGGSTVDYAIGYNTNELWLSSTSASTSVAFYGGTTRLGGFTSTGANGLLLNSTGSLTNAHLAINGGLSQISWMQFGLSTGSAIPATTTRSVGTKIVLNPTLGPSDADVAIGIASNEMWFSMQQNTTTFSVGFYGGGTKVMNIGGTGVLNLNQSTGRFQIQGTQVVGPRITGWGAPTGTISRAAFTTTASATYVQAELTATIEALKAVITDLRTHGLINN